MPPTVTNAFRTWLKGNVNIKLSSDAAVTRVTYEGITNFESLTDFDKTSIEYLPRTCKERILAITPDIAAGIAAEAEVPGANVGTISVRRLITAMKAARYYQSINRAMNSSNMHYTNVLSGFKVEEDAYADLLKKTEPEVPLINDKDNDRRVIKWAPNFLDCLSRTYGSKGPLVYVLRDDVTVPSEVDDPLQTDPTTNVVNSYFGKSGCLSEELIARLPHQGPIYKHDNATVFLKIEKASRSTSVESTVKAFARKKDGRGAFLAVMANHAGDTKYRAIYKKRVNLLTNIKWNGRSYPLETHVSNHRQAIDDIKECKDHITVTVPDGPQRVEYLIDSINSSDTTLQATIGLIRANSNNSRNDFETAASSLIEVDPYKRQQRHPSNKGGAQVSGVSFAGRGNTGVDLRWHHPKEYKELSNEQKDELSQWQSSSEGKKILDKSKKEAAEKRKKRLGDKKRGHGAGKSNEGNWKKKMKYAIKTPNGLKTVMALLGAEESSNKALQAELTASTASTTATSGATAPKATVASTFPATQIKLSSILKRNKD